MEKGISISYFICSLTYGGVIEEVLLRWFLMSLIAWLIGKIVIRGKDMEMLVQFALLSINSDFATYFQKEDCNPQRDMLTLGSATLMLDDEEFSQFIQEYGTLVQKHMENKPNEKRKARKITFISSPNLE